MKQRENVICLNEAPFFGGLENKDSCGWVVLREGICVWKEGACVPPISGARDPQSAVEYEFSCMA